MICSLVMRGGEGLEGPRKTGSSQLVKNPPDNAGDARDVGSIPGPGRSPGVGNATHPSILAWEIPWTGKHGRLQSMGLQRGRHDQAHTETDGASNRTSFSTGEAKQVEDSNLCIHGALSSRKAHRGYLQVFYYFEPN